LSSATNDAEGWNRAGLAFVAERRLVEAERAFRSALAARPDFIDALFHLAELLRVAGRFEESERLFARVLELRPGFAEGYNRRGLVLEALKRFEESESAFRRAIALKPGYIEALDNLANRMHDRGETASALEIADAWLRERPHDLSAAASALAYVLPVVSADVDEDRRALDGFDARLPALARAQPAGTDAPARLPFYLAYRAGNQLDRLRRYGDAASASVGARWGGVAAKSSPPSAGGRVRVAIVTAFFASHPVWEILVRGVARHLDREKFDLVFVHTGTTEDACTTEAKGLAARFHARCQDMARAVDVLREESPHILLYPELGMDSTSYKLAGLRLAPVQCTSWGHPVTSGLPTVDYFLSGEVLEGQGAEAHYREKLVRLPGTGVATIPPTAAVAQTFDPARHAPRAEGKPVRFALCQMPYKFAPEHDELYARIAESVGNCEFWLPVHPEKSAAGARLLARMGRVFRSRGLDAGRFFRSIPWLPPAEFAGFLERMDVYLDCPAFSGYTTALQAVRRGLPIVTLEGEFLRQRLAAGLLRTIGVTDTIATSRDACVDLAVQLARDAARRGKLRERLRAAAGNADNRLDAVRAFEKFALATLAGRPA
jgi:predicted O-linked N-acetylglucosamine transferase (SPINDLY family)